MPSGRPARILIVDDDPLLLELLTDTLAAIGYETAPAADGAIALDMLQNEQFDLMISDIKMPRLDGLQLLKRVRRRYPRLPVLFITGFSSREMIGSVAPDGVLAKPFRIAHIESMIQQALERKDRGPVERQKELLILDGAARVSDAFLSGLSGNGFVPFTYPSVNEAVKELENNQFSAILVDIVPSGADPLVPIGRLRRLAPDTPLILNADLFPIEAQERIINEFPPAGFSPAPFTPSAIVELIGDLIPLPRR